MLVKPPRTTIGLDGFATLLGLPEVVVPVGAAPAAAPNGSSGDSSSSSSGAAEDPEPPVNCMVALAGQDAKVVTVGAAFQESTQYHLQRPPVLQEGPAAMMEAELG